MKVLDLHHGAHRDIPHDVYHQRVPGLVSKHALDLVHKAPSVYKAWLDGAEDEQTPQMAFGEAFHIALLEPARFELCYHVEPDFGDCRKKDNKVARDAWRAERVGCTFLEQPDFEAIRGMVKAVREHPLAGLMIADGTPELTLRWSDDGTDLECKARADYHVARLRMGVDVKSTLDASPEEFRKSAARYGYHRQDAFYRQAFAAVGMPIDHFIFVAVEKKAPYLVGLYTLDADAVRRGYASVSKDIERLAECLEKDAFPGLESTIKTLDLPPWAA